MAATDLQGKVVVITGATTGIGEATAVEFAKYGAKLVLCGRNLEGLTDTKQQCVKQGLVDTDIAIVTGDICQDETLDLIVKTSVEKFHKVDILFLNAVKGKHQGTVLNPSTVETLDFFYQILIRSPYKLTQKLSTELIKTKGVIIINSSVNSVEFISPGVTPYGIMKAGQDQMARLLALTFANKGVRVNAIRPGPVKTNFFSETDDDNPHTKHTDKFAVFVPLIPLEQSLPTCEEIARVVVFLSSNQSACMTGTLITTDKGFRMTHPAVDWKQF